MNQQTQVQKADILLIKSFLEQAYPPFVAELSLNMEVDYIAGLCTRFLKNEGHLQFQLMSLNSEEESAILNYLDAFGNKEDEIFYLTMKAVIVILNKYYNDDGSYRVVKGTKL